MLRQSRQNVSQPGARVDIIQLAGLDQRVQRCRPMATHIRASEGPVPAPNCNAADRPLGGIVRQADPPVLEEERE